MDDVEYFRKHPARNWRLREKTADDPPLTDGRISLGRSGVLAFREVIGSRFLVETTLGPENDPADPWTFWLDDRTKIPVRASYAWQVLKHIQKTRTNPLVSESEPIPITKDYQVRHQTMQDEFIEWLSTSPVRTARLAALTNGTHGPLNQENEILIGELLAHADQFTVVERCETNSGVGGADRGPITEFPWLWVRTEHLLSKAIAVAVFKATFPEAERFLVIAFSQSGDISYMCFKPPDWTWSTVFSRALRLGHPEMLYAVSVFYDRVHPKPTVVPQPKIHPAPTASQPKELPMSQKPASPSPHAAIMEKIKAQIEQAYVQRQKSRQIRIDTLRSAFEQYERATEHDLLIDFAIRNGVESAEKMQAPDAAMELFTLVEALPEVSGERDTTVPTPPVVSSPEVEEDDTSLVAEPTNTSPAADYPIFASMVSNDAPLIVLGGRCIKEKLDRLKKIVGAVEWVETFENEKDVPRVIDRVANNRKVAGVVYLNEFMATDSVKRLTQAANRSQVPIAPAGRGGTADFARALSAIEEKVV